MLNCIDLGKWFVDCQSWHGKGNANFPNPCTFFIEKYLIKGPVWKLGLLISFAVLDYSTLEHFDAVFYIHRRFNFGLDLAISICKIKNNCSAYIHYIFEISLYTMLVVESLLGTQWVLKNNEEASLFYRWFFKAKQWFMNPLWLKEGPRKNNYSRFPVTKISQTLWYMSGQL